MSDPTNHCTEILTKEGDRCTGEKGHDGAHVLDLTTQPTDERKAAREIEKQLILSGATMGMGISEEALVTIIRRTVSDPLRECLKEADEMFQNVTFQPGGYEKFVAWQERAAALTKE
jgi:GTP cyclohydrolase FolE2